jgi:para-aminobenzoate synthetase
MRRREPAHRLAGRRTVWERHARDTSQRLSDRSIAFDHADQAIYCVSLHGHDAGAAEAANRWLEDVAAVLQTIERTAPPPRAPLVRAEAIEPYLVDTRDEYLAKIAACQEQIRAGESYEVCLTS